tara:strand:- start:1 stop:240 length:240 start_codon:yes stop_codon:yes gene_type:complete
MNTMKEIVKEFSTPVRQFKDFVLYKKSFEVLYTDDVNNRVDFKTTIINAYDEDDVVMYFVNDESNKDYEILEIKELGGT